MINLKGFEDFVEELLYGVPNICEEFANNSKQELIDYVSKRVPNLSGKNCVVINSIQFAKALADRGNYVYCIHTGKDIISSEKIHYLEIKWSNYKTDKVGFFNKIVDSFTKYKETSKSYVNGYVDVIFNFSCTSTAKFNFQKVSELNLEMFNIFFTPGITTWYSFDEPKVMMDFARKSNEEFGFKLKTNQLGKKIDDVTWASFGFMDDTERYITKFFISDDQLYTTVKYTGESLEDKDINGKVELGEMVIDGVQEPRIYAFKTAWVDDVLPDEDTALKVGDTNRDIMQRMNEWEKIFDEPKKLEHLGDWSAVLSDCGEGIDGKIFRDYTVHSILESKGKKRLQKEEFGADNILNGRYSREFFRNCKIEDVQDAIDEIKKLAKENRYDILSRLKDNTGKNGTKFIYPLHANTKKMKTRNLQEETIEKFEKRYTETKTMLMYAVMRFGKTYTACRCMDKWAGKFNVVVSGKVGVKNEWIGTINNSSQFFGYDAYDASDKTGGLKWMLGCSDERIVIGRDSEGKEITMRGPHPGKKYNTLEEYFADDGNAQLWWVVKGNDKVNDAYYETEEEAKENSEGREVKEELVEKKIVLFVSLQDLMGDLKGKKVDDKIKYIKDKHACFYEYPIDLMIIDEAHFATQSELLGATIGDGENAGNTGAKETTIPTPEKKKYKAEENPDDVGLDDKDDITDKEERETSYALGETMNFTPETRKLYLSGTPYDLMADQKFDDKDIIAKFGFKDLMAEKKKWDDANEQKSRDWIKANDEKKDIWSKMDDEERRIWLESHPDEEPYEDENTNPYRKEKNPYFGIPKMITLGYKMSMEDMGKYVEKGEFKFKLFFETRKVKDEDGQNAREFINEDQILKLFKVIDGAEKDTDLMTILDIPAFKKGDMLKNIVIVLPYRRCCDAFEYMMRKHKDEFKYLGDYKVIKATSELKEIDPDFAKDEVLRNVERNNNTITVTVGRLMTGVTVEPWDTMFYMRDLNKPQEYDQAKFRIQTPYIKEVSTLDINPRTGKLTKTKEPTLIDMKPQTLFVDFSPRRMFDMTKQRIFKHNAACGGLKDDTRGLGKKYEGVYALVESECDAERNFLPVALMEGGHIRECKTVDIVKHIMDLQKNVKMSKRMSALKKFPPASDAALLLTAKVKRTTNSKTNNNSKIDNVLGQVDPETKNKLAAALAEIQKNGGEIPEGDDILSPKRKSIHCSDADRKELQKAFTERLETIMKDIFMFIVLKNDNTDIPDFHRLWDAMTHAGADGRNYELVYNIFFEDLGIEDKGSLEDNVYAIKDALQKFVRVYLGPNQKIEEFVEMMYQTQKEFREDANVYENLKMQLEEYGNRLDKSEIITPDDTIKDLCKDLVIFNDGKILDCYCSKTGEIPYYLATDPKFKDNFDIDNYYMICRTGLIAELNRPAIQLLYSQRYPNVIDKDGKENFSDACVRATNKFMKDHIIITNQSIDHSEDEDEGSSEESAETTPVEETPETVNSSYVTKFERFIMENTDFDEKETNDIIKKIKQKWCKKEMIQFDTVIGNPPYSGNLHLDIISSVLPFMSKRATGCFIHPATWLINVRKNGKAKIYDALKKKLEGHIKSIDIENLNKEFGTGLYVPFSRTTIDMNKTYNEFDFTCCGDEKKVSSLYDCNMIGDYKTIWSILDKVQGYGGDMMKDHITKEDKGEGYWYAKYHEITSRGGLGTTACVNGAGMNLMNAFNNDIYYVNGYTIDFYHSGYSTIANNISETPLHTIKRGGANGSHITTEKIADNIYGTKEELENWKHFIFNNKLPLFINIVLTIDQNNNSKEFLPWLVDKQYTDEEINKMFGFTPEEIELIDQTLKKFERHSPWFKRYMCGRGVKDDEVTTVEVKKKKGEKKETPKEETPVETSAPEEHTDSRKPDLNDDELKLSKTYPKFYDEWENSDTKLKFSDWVNQNYPEDFNDFILNDE